MYIQIINNNIGGVIATIIKSFLIVKFSNVKYNDEIAEYVSKFKS